jgi:hypothetical protein
LSAFHALLVNIVPKVIAISGGYHGCHGVSTCPLHALLSETPRKRSIQNPY